VLPKILSGRIPLFANYRKFQKPQCCGVSNTKRTSAFLLVGRHPAARRNPDEHSPAPCPIAHSAVGRSRQTVVEPPRYVRMGRYIQAPHLAPRKDTRHVEVRDGKVTVGQVVTPI